MSEHEDPSDAELRAELAHLLRRVDPPPRPAVRAAEAACAWILGTDDPAPRPLVERDPDALAGALRGAADTSRVFRYRRTTIRVARVTSSPGARGYQLAGLVVPATAHPAVRAQTPAGEHRRVLDGSGRFQIDGLRHGPLRIVLAGGPEAPMATEWFVW